MISVSEFRALKIEDFVNDFAKKRQALMKELFGKVVECERTFDTNWYGSFYDCDRDGVIAFHYGKHTDSHLVAIELEDKESENPFSSFTKQKPTDPALSRSQRATICKSIGCFDIGSLSSSILADADNRNSSYKVIPGANGYSTIHVLKGGLLIDYLILEGSTVLITVHDPQLVLQNRIDTICCSIEECEGLKSEGGDDEYWDEAIRDYKVELNELRSLDTSVLSDALKTIFANPS